MKCHLQKGMPPGAEKYQNGRNTGVGGLSDTQAKFDFLHLENPKHQKGREIVANSELSAEIERLKAEFKNADPAKLSALEALIEQAAYERIYLRRLNEQALASGLVQFHPENATIQRSLPVSNEIAKHSAALTNITDKLMKHLAPVDSEDEDDMEAQYG